MKELPSIEEVETGYLISIPSASGPIHFLAEEIEQPKRKVLEATVTTWQEIPGQPIEPFTGNINFLSLSSRDQYRRQLDEAFGKLGWTSYLNTVSNIFKKVWLERPRSIRLVDAPEPSPTLYRLDPLCLSTGASVWFGDGGCGKTMLALWAARQMGAVLYVDYEWVAPELRRRLIAMGGGDDVHYMAGQGVGLVDLVPAIKLETRKWGIEYLVIDSAGLACAGEPEKAESAIRYFNALQAVGLPSTTIAHVTKAGEDHRPFGSAYWHHSARITWNVKGSDDIPDRLNLGLICRKPPSSGTRPKPFSIAFRFQDGRIEAESLSTVLSEFTDVLPPRQRIREYLLHSAGKASKKQIADELDISEEAVRKALQRMSDARNDGRGGRGDGQWWIEGSAEPMGQWDIP